MHKTINRAANARLVWCRGEERTADVVGIARPDERQDLVVSKDRHIVPGHPRGGAIERVGHASTNLIRRIAVWTETRPHRASRADLLGHEPGPIARDRARFADGPLEIPTEGDRKDQFRGGARAHLDRPREHERRCGVERTVVEPDERPVASVGRRDGRMRDRSALGDLGVVGPAEARSPAPLRHEDERPRACRDADELHQAGPAGWRDRPDFEPPAIVVVHRTRQ